MQSFGIDHEFDECYEYCKNIIHAIQKFRVIRVNYEILSFVKIHLRR